LHFLTPTRLKYNGRFLEDAPPFHVVVRTLLRRISSLSYFHCGRRWETDYRGWIERAQEVETETAEVRWVDWERYSTRQRQRMNLGGIRGRVTYAGELPPFLPLLRLGELIHVGKGATFGNGQYRMETEG
ncbi:MAG TPA: CRISPR system precrRNA processing endoribonuclease RAMP protein Cas6, partial [Anaerolineae bacterium]|nr:CRISPR system precrRNA processing endoribonuclease RAMP protein Cas6 [Anaerolineae bacterium]